MSFTPLSLTLIQCRLMVAQVPPRAVRPVPRHPQDAPRALCTSNPCAGSVQGQLPMLKAWPEEEHSIITAHLRRGLYLPYASVLPGSGTAGSLSLCQPQGTQGVSAQHHGASAHSAILLCWNLVWDPLRSLLPPHPKGKWESHTLVCAVSLTATARLRPYCSFL